MSNNPFLNTNVDEIFNHIFLEELQNKITIEEKGDLLKKQQLYEYKYEKMTDLITFFHKMKELNLFVKNHKDYNFYTFKYAKESLPFDFIVQDSFIEKNNPSPAIYVENPLSFEISIPNLDNYDNIVYELYFFSENHPDRHMFKDKYDNSNELLVDLSHFFSKNVYHV